jgi:integrase
MQKDISVPFRILQPRIGGIRLLNVIISRDMRSLQQAIESHAKGATPALLRYLQECNLNEWKDLTKSNLNDFRDYVAERVAQSTARTYFAVFKAILKRYEDDVDFCKDYPSILKAKNEKPVKTYLTMRELERLERVMPTTPNEQFVLDEFLIGAYTGMRISDAREISDENMANGYISYVSIKTHIHAVVPMKKGIAERIKRVQANECEMPLATYNRILRRLCKRAGITERVKVFKAGEHHRGEKWEYVSSHTARHSFATNLADLGVPILEICKCMGHTSTQMTERYIVKTKAELDTKALKYFQ